MNNVFWTIVKKEILDARRDGKSLATAFFMPAIFACIMYAIIQLMVSTQEKSQSFELAVRNGEAAAPLMQWLEESGIKVVPFEGSPADAITQDSQKIILDIPAEFPAQFRQGKPAKILLFADHSQTQPQIQLSKIRYLVQQWSAKTGALRMIYRGVPPDFVHPIHLQEIDTAKPQRRDAQILGGLPLFFLMIAFVSSLGMSTDMAAGEKERRTLEPLFITPISHWHVLFGKLAASFCVTFIITTIGIGIHFVLVNQSPLEELGLRIDLGLSQFLTIITLLVPVMLLASALQLMISFLSKSFKDAQSYNSLLTLIPMVPGFYLMFNSSAVVLWKVMTPIMGTQLLVMETINGEAISVLHAILSALGCLGIAAGVCLITAKLLQREAIISRG